MVGVVWEGGEGEKGGVVGASEQGVWVGWVRVMSWVCCEWMEKGDTALLRS